MKINLKELKNIIKKSSMNYSIEDIQLIIDKENVVSRMSSNDGTFHVFINKNNNIISEAKDTIKLNLQNPKGTLLRFVETIKENEVDFSFNEQNIKIKSGPKQMKLLLCHDTKVNTFERKMKEVDFNGEIEIDEEMMNIFFDIKKIGYIFNKIFLIGKDGKLFIETSNRNYTDLTDNYKIEIGNTDKEFVMMFETKTFSNMLTCLDNDKKYVFRYFFHEERNGGIMDIVDNDNSERYTIVSLSM